MRSRHLLVGRLLERSRLSVLKLVEWLLLELWLRWNQWCLRNELLRCGRSILSSVLWTDGLPGVLLPDSVCSGDRLLRLHRVTGCRVLR